MVAMNDTPAVTPTPKQCAQCGVTSDTVMPAMNLDNVQALLCLPCRQWTHEERLTAAYELYGAEFRALGR
jgi:hypothetical protein